MRTLGTTRGASGGRARGARSGGALALALIVVISVAALGAASLQISSAVSRRQARAVDDKRAFYAAEAGLAEAYAGVRLGRTGNVGTPKEPAAFGDGLFWVVATEEGDQVRLESTGMVGGGRAVLALVVERSTDSVAALGVFSGAELEIPAGSVIDGWDSALGPYTPPPPPAPAEEPASDDGGLLGGLLKPEPAPEVESAPESETIAGRIGSNAALAVAGDPSAPTVVSADLSCGPDHAITLGEGVVHTGTTAVAAGERALPPVDVPDVRLQRGVEHAGPGLLLVQPGEGGIEHLHVGEHAEVVLQGPASWVVGSLTTAAGATLSFDTTDGTVTLYVTDALELASSSNLVTSSTDPGAVVLQVAGELPLGARIEAGGTFYGVVYAPESEVKLGGALELFGALVAGRLTFTGPVRLHFDRNLATLAEEVALPRLVSWRIVELGAAGTGGDPFRALGLDRDALPSPADAHADQHLVIKYLDHGSTFQSYEGPESAFDWSDVQRVLYLERDGEMVVLPGGYGGAPQSPNVAAPADALVGLIHQTDPLLSSSELRDSLVAAAPLSSSVLLELLERTVSMASSDLRDVLNSTTNLSDEVLLSAIDEPALSVSHLVDALLFQSPLSPDVQAAVLARDPPLSLSDLTTLLGTGDEGEDEDGD